MASSRVIFTGPCACAAVSWAQTDAPLQTNKMNNKLRRRVARIDLQLSRTKTLFGMPMPAGEINEASSGWRRAGRYLLVDGCRDERYGGRLNPKFYKRESGRSLGGLWGIRRLMA